MIARVKYSKAEKTRTEDSRTATGSEEEEEEEEDEDAKGCSAEGASQAKDRQ